MTYQIGILGGGGISETHVRAVQEIAGGTVAAVCGQNAERVRLLAERAGATAYSNLELFLRHPLDAVIGKALTVDQANQLITAATQIKGLLVCQ